MFCINCTHTTTAVRNSRPNKKMPSVWRRRVCPACGHAFTTYEKPSLAENKPVMKTEGTEAFNLGRLIQSVAASFSHDIHKAQYDSLWLAETIESHLSTTSEALTPKLIAAVTYSTLKRFDELAALQYAAKHHLVTNVRRRGRPSLASPDL